MTSSLVSSVSNSLSLEQQAFSALLEESFNRSLAAGNVVVGEIIRIEKDHLVVDIGGKCEGMVPIREIPFNTVNPAENTALSERYSLGQIREFYILKDFDEDQPFALSLKRVDAWKDWEELSRMMDEETVMDVPVLATTRGGVLVQILSLKGFIPASQIRVPKTLEALVGDTIPAKLLEVNRSKNKLILSHRAAVFEAQSKQRAKTMKALEEGQIVTGAVVKITNFGAFIDINGIDGLLPLSEISWQRLKHPSDMLVLNQEVTVQVLSIDYENERISLSLKRLSSDPWDTVTTRYRDGDVITGIISKQLNAGFLVEMEPGIEAFCSYQFVPRDQVEPGQTAQYKVVSILANDRRITLEPAN